MTDEYVEGTWPKECLQRAFVRGAKWWQFHKSGSTMFSIERHEAEDEAVGRYGDPLAQAPVSDDAKGLNYYRAIVDQEDPDWLPDQIYLKQDSEGPVQGVYFAAGAHKCRTDRTGRVALRAPVGGDWLLYPKQFRVITWKKNEAENGG